MSGNESGESQPKQLTGQKTKTMSWKTLKCSAEVRGMRSANQRCSIVIQVSLSFVLAYCSSFVHGNSCL